MNLNYYLNEIKKAKQLLIKIFDYLYKFNNKKLNKTIYRLTEINEILTNLEIDIKIQLEEKNERL